MSMQQDHSRFKKIVRESVKRDIKKYMSTDHMYGQRGGKRITIPVPIVDLPRFKFGSKDMGGISQGDGEPGDSLGSGERQPGSGEGEAGSEPGEHIIESEFSVEELANIMMETLELPAIEPKGADELDSLKRKYNTVRPTGPESLRHNKRTFKRALKRTIASGDYDPKNPIVVPRKADKRYRGWTDEPDPKTQAVIIYMMDVSGSMGDEQKTIVRITAFWIDTLLRNAYPNLRSVYIIHDAQAREVDRETFYTTRESGGTMISSAYKLCMEVINERYPPTDWNIYTFHFSDGDNWSIDDTETSLAIIRDQMLVAANRCCYGQVESSYGSGQFMKDVATLEHVKLRSKVIQDRDKVHAAIKEFFS